MGGHAEAWTPLGLLEKMQIKGLFSRLFRRRSAEPNTPPNAGAAAPNPAAQTQNQEVPGFDPEATIFISPRLSMAGQQALRKLREFHKRGVQQYQWVCSPKCGATCKRAEAEGPYSVADALAGVAPVPGVGAYKECECGVVAFKKQ